MDELTVFINVKIDSLNELSKSIPLKVSKITKSNKEMIKKIIVNIMNLIYRKENMVRIYLNILNKNS